MMDVFFEIHTGNMREGPGSFEATRRAFSMIAELPPNPTILDIGCGPGAQTLDLSRLTDGQIVAVDNHLPFVQALNGKIHEHGLENRVKAMPGDMFDLDFPETSFDVIWSEGAIYIIGFEKGLLEWRLLLKERAYIAVSELTWLRSHPPREVAAFWNEEYPAMNDISGNLAILARAGYAHVGHFTLSEQDWWQNYYGSIEKKLAVLLRKYRDNEQALAVLELEQREIDLFRRHSSYYNYVFYVGQRV